MSEWNWKEENIYKHIIEKYSLPKLIVKKENLKGKTIEGIWSTFDRTYIFHTDKTILVLSSNTDYDGALDCPTMVTELDFELVMGIVAYLNRNIKRFNLII